MNSLNKILHKIGTKKGYIVGTIYLSAKGKRLITKKGHIAISLETGRYYYEDDANIGLDGN